MTVSAYRFKIMPISKEIAILSAPRHGTNFFISTLGFIPRAVTFGELFNPGAVIGLKQYPEIMEYVGRDLGLDLTDVKDKSLVSFFRNQPAGALDLLRQAMPNRVFFSYKVFPGQLGETQLNEVLTDVDKSFIIITRRRLDAFISYKKATMQNVWLRSDTTDIKPEINISDLISWSNRNENFLASCLSVIQSQKSSYRIVNYEEEIDVPVHELAENQKSILRDLNIDSAFHNTSKVKEKISKQDLETDVFQKVKDGDRLRDSLIKENLLDFSMSAYDFN